MLRTRKPFLTTAAAATLVTSLAAGGTAGAQQSNAAGEPAMQAQSGQNMQQQMQQSGQDMPSRMQKTQTQMEPGQDQAQAGAQLAPQANAQMQAVLDKLQELGAKPIATLSVEEARSQPSPADAVQALMKEKDIQPDPALQQVRTEDVMIPGPGGEVAARIYRPGEGEGPFPVIVYYHGGGWVIADIDAYDDSARALASGADAIVVSADYRLGPEHPFPAAHEDAFAAYEWVTKNASNINGDPRRIAVAGESAGGNLAANVAIMAVERQLPKPVHQLLVYPVAGYDFGTRSYEENATAAPLDRAAMEWFFENALEGPEQAEDPRIALVERENLQDLPPATVITAEIDPLRSEGETYADNLRAAGVEVDSRNFEGVTHEFFGMGSVVDEAREAVGFATANLREAFGEPAGSVTGTTTSRPAEEPGRQTSPQRSQADDEGSGVAQPVQ